MVQARTCQWKTRTRSRFLILIYINLHASKYRSVHKYSFTRSGKSLALACLSQNRQNGGGAYFAGCVTVKTSNFDNNNDAGLHLVGPVYILRTSSLFQFASCLRTSPVIRNQEHVATLADLLHQPDLLHFWHISRSSANSIIVTSIKKNFSTTGIVSNSIPLQYQQQSRRGLRSRLLACKYSCLSPPSCTDHSHFDVNCNHQVLYRARSVAKLPNTYSPLAL